MTELAELMQWPTNSGRRGADVGQIPIGSMAGRWDVVLDQTAIAVLRLTKAPAHAAVNVICRVRPDECRVVFYRWRPGPPWQAYWLAILVVCWNLKLRAP